MIRNMINFTLLVGMIGIYLVSVMYIFGFIMTVALTVLPKAVAFVLGAIMIILIFVTLSKFG